MSFLPDQRVVNWLFVRAYLLFIENSVVISLITRSTSRVIERPYNISKIIDNLLFLKSLADQGELVKK